MGLREKARKSLQPDATADRVEQSAPMLLELEASEREAEAKARETQLRKELTDARRLSEAKGGGRIPRSLDRPPGERAHATRTESLDGSRQAGCGDSRDPGSESRSRSSPRETGRARSGSRGKPQEAPGRGAYPRLQVGERARRGEERPREDAI